MPRGSNTALSFPFVALILLLRSSLLFDVVSSQSPRYRPVLDFAAEAYLGRWFQMYTTIGFILLELGGQCTTADYSLTESGNIFLVNQARPPYAPKILARTTGFGYPSPDPGEGVFLVEQSPFITPKEDGAFEPPGNYWILALGPRENGDGDYLWACVSDPDMSSAFVLARDPVGFKGSQFEQDALAVFEQFGFDSPTNKLIPTSHKNCKGYPDVGKQ